MRKVVLVLACVLCAGLPLTESAIAQGNDDDYTPLNSRIRRDRAFPTENPARWNPGEMSRVARERSRNSINVFSYCLWDRSNERALGMLERTDFGFSSFDQIGLTPEEAPRRFSFPTCLRRVANSLNSGIVLRFTPQSLRIWLLQEAYFDRFPDGATWIVPGNLIDERTYPLSAGDVGVQTAMDLADCIVATDPVVADFLYRTTRESEDENDAIAQLMPSISGCIPEGVELDMSRNDLRTWLGEGLWHAANHNSPAPPEVPTPQTE